METRWYHRRLSSLREGPHTDVRVLHGDVSSSHRPWRWSLEWETRALGAAPREWRLGAPRLRQRPIHDPQLRKRRSGAPQRSPSMNEAARRNSLGASRRSTRVAGATRRSGSQRLTSQFSRKSLPLCAQAASECVRRWPSVALEFYEGRSAASNDRDYSPNPSRAAAPHAPHPHRPRAARRVPKPKVPVLVPAPRQSTAAGGHA